MQNKIVELKLQIKEDESYPERVASLTSSFVKRARELDLEYIAPVVDENAPEDIKSDPITVGAIILGISVAALPALIGFIQNWVGERRKITIEAPNGAKIEFVPSKRLSEDEILALMKRMQDL